MSDPTLSDPTPPGQLEVAGAEALSLVICSIKAYKPIAKSVLAARDISIWFTPAYGHEHAKAKIYVILLPLVELQAYTFPCNQVRDLLIFSRSSLLL